MSGIVAIVDIWVQLLNTPNTFYLRSISLAAVTVNMSPIETNQRMLPDNQFKWKKSSTTIKYFYTTFIDFSKDLKQVVST